MIEIYDAEMGHLGRTWNYADMEITHDLNTGQRQMTFRALYRDDQPELYLMALNREGTWGSISEDPEGGIQTFDLYDPTTYTHRQIDLGAPPALPTGNYPIKPEYHVRTENDVWTVKKIAGNKIDGLTVSCVLDTEELENTFYKSLTAEEQAAMTLDERTETMRSAAAGTFTSDRCWNYWRCGGDDVVPPESVYKPLAVYGEDHVDWTVLPSGITRSRAMQLQNFTQLGYLQAIATAYMCEIKIDSLRMEVSFCDRVGEDKGIYLTRGFNVDKIDKESDSYDYKTVIYPVGKDGLTIANATGTEYSGCSHEAGSEVLTNFSYSSKPIIYRWEDTTYETAEALAEDGGRLLADLSHPIEAYSVSPRYVQASTDLQHDTSQWNVGDTVTLADSATDSLVTQRIVKKKEYPLAPWKNSFEIANCILTWAQIQAKIKAMEQITMGTKSSGRITVQEILHAGTTVKPDGGSDPDLTTLSNMENTLALAGGSVMTKSARVARVNAVLDMTDTSGTESAQINRAANALSLSASASTGSAVLDGFDARITKNESDVAAMNSALRMADEESEPTKRLLHPTRYREKFLYDVGTGSEYGPNVNYAYAFFDCVAGRTYYMTGTAASNAQGHPLGAWYDENGTLIERFGTTANTTYTQEEVVAPTGAVSFLLESNRGNVKVEARELFVSSGSEALDELSVQQDELKYRVNALAEKVEAQEPQISEGPVILPDSLKSGYIYNVVTKTEYTGDAAANYSYAIYTVKQLGWYFVSGASASGSNEHPLCGAYDHNGTLLDTYGTDPSAKYEDLLIQLPSGAETLVVNSTRPSAVIGVKEGVVAEDEAARGYNLDIAEGMVRLAKRNPFAFSALDKGYCTFVVDDLLPDLDSVASIFEEFGYPLGVAAIPDRLNVQATFLQTARGNYAPGMTMREIMDQVVADGGEILTHNTEPVTADNQSDYEFMHAYFSETKNGLTDAGFTVRGIIRAGGTGAVSGTAEIEKWLIGNYEYSNMGSAANYAQDRITINQPIADVKAQLLQAKQNGTWVRWMVHGYDYGGGTTFAGESDLREILQYCQDIGLPVVTYAYMFDNFSSTELHERLKAISA